ncbi:ATPase [Shewanella submarina]|uniref:BadF/BadG/BcrA/BcrD ATPase family protein n=1 Tax=Shewanella submarina TaxID=2016376 RepID=A0ABV7G8G1_9GAMM|nr:BadF/BadG/BcrA/BcrD ATPase family protein [Shewanella submarina]MCL1036808.1 ATPase [Shewanella submarina]
MKGVASKGIAAQADCDKQGLLFLGVDGGGSRCRTLLKNFDGEVLGQGEGKCANPVIDYVATISSITSAARQALANAGLGYSHISRLVVGAGLAGLHLPAARQQMSQWQHPFHRLYLGTDLDVANLGAHDGEDGGLIILGTGFAAIARHHGKQMSLGGYGFPINATGSGSWLGLEAVKAVLLAVDGLGPETSLTQCLMPDDDPLKLATEFQNSSPTSYATLAPHVLTEAEKGDYVAGQLMQDAAEFVSKVIRRMRFIGVNQIVLSGSISRFVMPYLSDSDTGALTLARYSPQEGAIMMAMRHLSLESESSNSKAGGKV